MHNENRFLTLADATLSHLYERLDAAYERGEIDDLDLSDGVLTIDTLTGGTFVLNKHAPTLQLWLASPLSGGLHFSYSDAQQAWALPDGTTLLPLLERELRKAAAIDADL